jgi:hypothetical protein
MVSELEERAPGSAVEPADPRDRLEERLDFLAAMQELERLPERMQQAVIMHSQV